MQFTIRNAAANYGFMQFNTIMNAKTIIIYHKITPGEYKLNKYLIDTYGVDLKSACLYLISRCKLYKDLSNSITILFPDSDDDKLASIITYGNGSIKGSNLLKEAFFRDID